MPRIRIRVRNYEFMDPDPPFRIRILNAASEEKFWSKKLKKDCCQAPVRRKAVLRSNPGSKNPLEANFLEDRDKENPVMTVEYEMDEWLMYK